MYSIGDKFHLTTRIDSMDVISFATVSHDLNPLYHDDLYVQKTIFDKPIAHSNLVVARISALLGSKICDQRKHYIVHLQQKADFLNTVYIGDTLTITATIEGWIQSDNELNVAIEVVNQNGKQVVIGTNTVKIMALEEV